MTFLLPYQPPYHWPAMLAFLAARAVPATEQVDATTYRRSIGLRAAPLGADAAAGAAGAADAVAGIVTVTDDPQRQALRVLLSPGLAGAQAVALDRIAQMFDLACDPRAVAGVLGKMPGFVAGLRLPGAADPFEIAVRAILGQQVTVAGARTIATRLVGRFGSRLPPEQEEAGTANATACGGPTHLFPSAASTAALDAAQLGEIGIIRSRGEAIIAVAREVASGRLRLQAGAPVEPTLAALTAIRGIGPWTAHYIAMRTLGWTDAFPPGDVVVLKSLQAPTRAAATALAEGWRPWRSYAVLQLWRRMAVNAN